MQHLEVTAFDVLSVLCKDMNHWNCCSCKELKSLCWTKQQQVFLMEGVVFFHRWSCVLQLLVINDSTVSCVRLHTVDFLIILFFTAIQNRVFWGEDNWKGKYLFLCLKKKRIKIKMKVWIYTYMYRSTRPPTRQTYRSFSATETHGMKLLVHNLCADVNVRWGLELCSLPTERWRLAHIVYLSTQWP